MQGHRNHQPIGADRWQARFDQSRKPRRERDVASALEGKHKLARGIVVKCGGSDAIVLIEVDEPVSEAVLAQVKALPNVVRAKALKF